MRHNNLIICLLAARSLAFLPSAPIRGIFQLKSSNTEPNPADTELLESAFSKGYKNNETPELDTEQFSLDERTESVDIPKTGISVSETIEDSQRDQFSSVLVPVKTLPGVAQIVTKTNARGSFDPIRYIVALKPPLKSDEEAKKGEVTDYIMTDIPPFSESLAASIRKFIKGGRLVALLMTSRTSVHYDEGPSVFTTRRSHLDDWTAVFPDLAVAGYRLDVPRDSASRFTQKLNGYGPWAWNDALGTFEETGQQLITKEWDTQTIKTMLKKGVIPLVDDDVESTSGRDNTPEGIRRREEGKRLLAIYTPGNTHGTLSYVFPETNVVVSAFTIPIEDIGSDNDGHVAGPSMDTRGYITTSAAGMKKQMESARHLVNNYADRFGIVLPSRSDPFFLDEMNSSERKSILLSIIAQYDLIGEKYSNAGQEEDSEDDDEDDM